MSARNPLEAAAAEASAAIVDAGLSALLDGQTAALSPLPMAISAVIGRLIGMDAGATALVLLPGETVAVPARSAVDLHRSHIGKQVALVFEGSNGLRPIVIGVMRDAQAWSAPETSGHVEVDVDGQRMVLSARQELVLRCGAATITLDHEGRITIRGTQVISHSKGVNRIRGGSVQLN